MERHVDYRDSATARALTSEADRPAEQSSNTSLSATPREVTFRDLLIVLLRRRRAIAAVPFATAIVAVAIAFLLPVKFTATTAFVPEASDAPGLPAGLAGVAGQLGLSLGGEAGNSPQFYASALTSRAIIDKVLSSAVNDYRRDGTAAPAVTLMEFLDVGGDDAADSLFRARKKFTKRVAADVDEQTSVVTLSVELESPRVAALVADRMVELLGDFNADVRRSKGRDRRVFAEKRLREAADSLRFAEEGMRAFLEANRTWTQSPQLTFEHERIQRALGVWQEIVLSLRREYEMARVAEVNDVPVFTSLYNAEIPQEKSSPRRTLLVLGLVALSLVSAMLWAFSADYLSSARNEPSEESLEFRTLLAAARADVARLFGRRQPTSAGGPS